MSLHFTHWELGSIFLIATVSSLNSSSNRWFNAVALKETPAKKPGFVLQIYTAFNICFASFGSGCMPLDRQGRQLQLSFPKSPKRFWRLCRANDSVSTLSHCFYNLNQTRWKCWKLVKEIAVTADSSVFSGDPHCEALWGLRSANCNKKQTSFHECMSRR